MAEWILVIIFALLVGSFLNVCIYRLPREESIVFPGSHCPNCQHPIRWYDNIPVFSFLVLTGRCRYCRKAISWLYPVVEIMAAVVAVWVLFYFGWRWESGAIIGLGWAFIVLSMIDFEHYILPDVINWPGIFLGVMFSFWARPPFVDWHSSLVGAGVGGLGLWAFAAIFAKIMGKQGMGLGDVKLLALIGAWMGWQALPLTLFGAALLGTMIGLGWIILFGRDRRLPIPFGPYLVIAAWLYLFYGQTVYRWYLGYMFPNS